MKHVRKTVLLWYSPREMYDLVTAVEDYPAFLPWCRSARVVERHGDGTTASIDLAYMGVHHSFTTRNVEVAGESVTLALVDGPFSMLDGTWRFIGLGSGEQGGRACKIEFDLRYGFASRALESVLSPAFDKVANTFVDSFVRRAEVVYGPR
ncbi:MAG: type II toxin-antitoxin system RatA family toxin [Burkholderiales bacterium]|nr:type II toxin-antitoxin system RatA family toxin [Burkholderiales bacterium]MDE1929031.1 type II toxin-antitoxin system RatA family toxin [Burkholderiales bacterium]MDE2160293.1 type II toxin-antitoxin system RatA family toxin [Burkholderiales bacterium]MDE2501747.1 type II toxin-antitoxin system RatA family toxin [Burkholderiales bacterium]